MSEWRRAGITSHATRPSVRDPPSALFLQWPGEWLTKAIDACANRRRGPRSPSSPLALFRRLNAIVWTGFPLPSPRPAASFHFFLLLTIHVGGKSRHGALRAARYGDGWYGFNTDPEATKRSVDWIRGYIENGERPSKLGNLEISVTPPIPISKEVICQYEDIGVHRLIPWLNAPTLEDTLRYVDELGALLSG
jgi:hypothetical protein